MTALPPKRQHFLALDLLRGVAALAVLLLHWLEGNGNHWFHGGHLAVDFFFMLSGFVMAYSYTARLKAGLGLWNFFLLRLIRLYPMIVVGIVLGFIRFAMRTIATHDETMPISFLLIKVVQNLFMVPNFQDGLNSDMFVLNLALWSLFFEFVAYILFGLFMYRASNLLLVIIAIVSGIGVWAWLYQEYGLTKHILPYLSFEKLGYISGLSRVIFSFTLGLLAFEVYKSIPKPVALNGWIYAIVLFAFLSLPLSAISPNAAFFVATAGFPAFIILAAGATLPERTLGLAKLFGDLSYPLYIVHTPLLWLIDGIFKVLKLNLPFSNLWYAVIIFPIIILASYLAFKWYDEPLRAYLTKLYKKSVSKPVSS